MTTTSQTLLTLLILILERNKDKKFLNNNDCFFCDADS